MKKIHAKNLKPGDSVDLGNGLKKIVEIQKAPGQLISHLTLVFEDGTKGTTTSGAAVLVPGLSQEFIAHLKERGLTPAEIQRYQELDALSFKGVRYHQAFPTKELAAEFARLDLKRSSNTVFLGVEADGEGFAPTFNCFD